MDDRAAHSPRAYDGRRKDMGMIPDDFFEIFVLGNYDEYRENPGCIRRAFNAAVSASHLADHYLAYYRKRKDQRVKSFGKIDDFVRYLSVETNGCFGDIRSMANAYKHLYTSHRRSQDVCPSISSTGAVESISFPREGAAIALVDVERNEDKNSTGQVILNRRDGQSVEYLPRLEKVIEYWRKFLDVP